MPPTSPDAELIAWIAREATTSNDMGALALGVCERLVAGDLPLWRLSLMVPAIDPVIRGTSVIWRRGGALTRFNTDHVEGDAVFRRSPVFALLEADLRFGRWRLDDVEAIAPYPLLGELRAGGGTDYVVFVVPFAADTALIGMGVSIATDRPGGFAEADIGRMEALLPALGLAVFRQSLWQASSEALNTYLGPMTAARVFAGHVRRGQGETIAAAILLADLAGFATLADQWEPSRVVEWLNEHLEALGEAVIAEGGEILKFMGDGLLAVFPVAGSLDARPCLSCARALRAGEAAAAANRAVNERRRAAALPELRADIVLHFGDVIYGNVGTTRRLDFTTIGRAVNEASRIEKLCEEVGRSLILSDSFVVRCDRAVVPLGAFALRGLSTPQTVWGLG